MPLLQAKVKGVLSGDTLILTNPKGLEKTFSLAYVSAPKFKREEEEVWQCSPVCSEPCADGREI